MTLVVADSTAVTSPEHLTAIALLLSPEDFYAEQLRYTGNHAMCLGACSENKTAFLSS
jgi:hypothetical protein